MWKIIVGGLVFAGLALWVLSKGGDLDMSGEKHGIEVSDHAPAASAPAAPASAVMAPEPASAPASAASQ